MDGHHSVTSYLQRGYIPSALKSRRQGVFKIPTATLQGLHFKFSKEDPGYSAPVEGVTFEDLFEAQGVQSCPYLHEELRNSIV